jgi:hypothetical protein
MTRFNVGFVIFPNLTQLDFTGPLQVLNRLPGSQTHIAAKLRVTRCMSDLLAERDDLPRTLRRPLVRFVRGGTEVNLVILDLPLGQEDGLDLRDCKDKHVILRVGHRLDGDNGAGADMGVSVRPSVVLNLTFL